MSEPRRWKDSPDAPIGVRELLGSAARSRRLDDKTLRRGARRLSPISVAPAAIAATSAGAKLAAAGAVGLATAAGVVYVDARHGEPATETPTVSAHATPSEGALRAAAPEAASTPDVSAEPAPRPSPSARMPRTQPPRAALDPAPEVTEARASEAPPVVVSSLAEELPLLEKARARMARSPESSLDALAEHRARFPHGQLEAERDLMELDALRRTGRVNEARVRAHTWLARDPSGLHAARVRAILVTLE